MKFKLEFDCDNAAFENDLEGEVANILRGVENIVLFNGRGNYGTVRDGNGNTIGSWSLT